MDNLLIVMIGLLVLCAVFGITSFLAERFDWE